MSAVNVMLGPDAVVDINTEPFGLVHLSYRVVYRLEDVTTIDDTSGRVDQSPYRKLRVTFTAQRQSDVTYHSGVTNLTTPAGIGAGFSAGFWLNGRNDPSQLLFVAGLKAETFSGEAGVAGSQPQTITVEAESDGDFFLPGE